MARLSVLFLLVVLAFQAPELRGQVLYGSIVGTITDQTGAVVPQADVKAINPQTGETREVRADEAGRYTIGNVLPGTYEVRVTAQGFRPVVSTGVT
ncbi:MAG TPA: carboxypeptidase-like regulatory domain-containing protein, partial [Bryobacteraceae bacterium]